MNYVREIVLQKLGGKCVGCGCTETSEFDHIDPSTKSLKYNKNCRPKNLNGGRPKNYTFLGKTDRIRVPYVQQFSTILLHLNRIAELGHDPTDYLEEFIERLEAVE